MSGNVEVGNESYDIVVRRALDPLADWRTFDVRLESQPQVRKRDRVVAAELGQLSLSIPGKLLNRDRAITLEAFDMDVLLLKPPNTEPVSNVTWKEDLWDPRGYVRYVKVAGFMLRSALPQLEDKKRPFTVSDGLVPKIYEQDEGVYFWDFLSLIGCSPYLGKDEQTHFYRSELGKVLNHLDEIRDIA